MKGEKDSTVRRVLGRWIAIFYSVFVIYAMATLRVQELQMLGIFLSFTLALAFIHYPLVPGKPDSKPFILIDLFLAALSFTVGIYIFIDYWDFIFRVGIPTPWDTRLSFITVILVLEATRRVVGWPLLIIAFVILGSAAYELLSYSLNQEMDNTLDKKYYVIRKQMK